MTNSIECDDLNGVCYVSWQTCVLGLASVNLRKSYLDLYSTYFTYVTHASANCQVTVRHCTATYSTYSTTVRSPLYSAVTVLTARTAYSVTAVQYDTAHMFLFYFTLFTTRTSGRISTRFDFKLLLYMKKTIYVFSPGHRPSPGDPPWCPVHEPGNEHWCSRSHLN